MQTQDNYDKITIEQVQLYAQLMEKYGQWLNSYCSRCTHSVDEAMGLHLDIEEALWRKLHLLDTSLSEQQHRRWFKTAAMHASVDHFRHRKRTAQMQEILARREEDYEEEREVLMELIEHLSDDDKEIIQMNIKGYNAIDIANQKGASDNAIRKRLQRIVEKLKKIKEEIYG